MKNLRSRKRTRLAKSRPNPDFGVAFPLNWELPLGDACVFALSADNFSRRVGEILFLPNDPQMHKV